jgi:hypothetical protein
VYRRFFWKISSPLMSIFFFYFFSKGPNFAFMYQNGESQYIIYFHSWTFLDQSLLKTVVYIPRILSHLCSFA